MLGSAVSLALIATPITRGDRGRDRDAAVRRLRPQGRPAGRRGPREHGRRGDLRAAAQLDAAAAARAHARGRVGPQRPRGRPARARADRVHQAARLRPRRRDAAARAPARDRARGRRGWSAGSACRRSSARSSRPRGSTRSPRWRSRRSRSAAPTRCTARASSPSTWPGSRSARRAIPAQQTITAFHQGLAWVAQVGMFLTLGLLVFPHQLDDIVVEGTVLALVAAAVARPLAVFPATLFASFGKRERLVLGWAGPARRGPGRARDVPGARRGAGQPRAVQHRLLRRARLDAAAGHDVRAARGAPRRHHERARAAAAAGRGRHDPPARRGDPRVPDRRRRRDRRPPRARPRPAARRGRQRDRARRPGDPAARDHAPARRRPHPRADPAGERARALRHPRPLALRPDRPPAAPAARAARPRGGVLDRRLARARTATPRGRTRSAGAR